MQFVLHSGEEEVKDKLATAPLSLPNDVVEEIFIRLPVKTLIRFRSLSKQWSLRITSQSFAEKHLKIASSYQVNHPSVMPFPSRIIDTKEIEFQPLCLEEGTRPPLPYTRLSFPLGFPGWIHYSKSCDGLFCIQSSKSNYVVNPATRWLRPLPLSNYQILNSTNLAWNLVTTAAFVKADVDYKLVWLYNSDPKEEGVTTTTCEVFDFRANAWRYLTCTPSYRLHGMPESANGSVFWFRELHSNHQIDIIAFDIRAEKFRCLLPNLHSSSDPYIHVVMCTLDDRLCLIRTNSVLDKVFWRLKSSEEDMWEKFYTINYLSTPLSWIGNEYSWRAVTMCKNKKEMLLSHPCSMNLVAFNLQTGSVRIIVIQPHTVCMPYFETLISHI